MDHSKFIASIQKEEFISSFKSSAYYYIQQQSLNETTNLVNFELMSLTELYFQQIMQVSCWNWKLWKVSMKSIFSN